MKFRTEREKQFYFDGYCDALLSFGIWQSGKQTIGCLERPVKEVLELKRVELCLPAQPFVPSQIEREDSDG